MEPTLLQRNRRLIGAWYRNDLARRLGEMGYVLVPTQVGGLPSFELAGYSPAMLEAFSTRRRDISTTWRTRAGSTTRRPRRRRRCIRGSGRTRPAPGALSAMWKARAEALGLARDADEVRLDRTERGFARPPARFTALEAVWQAVDLLEERHAVFSESDLLAAALGREPGRHTHVDLQAEIGRLARGRPSGGGRRRRADDAAHAQGREGGGPAHAGWQGHGTASCSRRGGRRRLAATELTEGQKAAVRLILRSPDPVVGVQGFAGTGKTRMLNEVATLAGGTAGVRPRAVVGGGAGARRRGRYRGDHPAMAADALRVDRRGDGDGGGDCAGRETFEDAVVVVDESSMVGTCRCAIFSGSWRRSGVARLVLVGDSLQLRSVAAGQPFRLLQRAGMATARMDDVIRQRSVDLKAAVEHMVAGDPALAVESIAADVRELPADALAGTAARLWLSLPPDARKGRSSWRRPMRGGKRSTRWCAGVSADEGRAGAPERGDRPPGGPEAHPGPCRRSESYRPGDVVVATRT